MQQMNMSGKEIKAIIPDVVTDLNYTTGLMENLLHWVKSQMNAANISPMELDMEEITDETHCMYINCRRPQRKFPLSGKWKIRRLCIADRDMVTLVLRNLLSNAIKFTPEKGKIIIRLKTESSYCRISVIDNGIGMDQETLVRDPGKFLL